MKILYHNNNDPHYDPLSLNSQVIQSYSAVKSSQVSKHSDIIQSYSNTAVISLIGIWILNPHFLFNPRLASTCPAALCESDRTLANRVLGFRKLSRQACAFHALYRDPVNRHPFVLFKLLLDQEPLVPDMGPPCLYDEVADTFFRVFPNQQSQRSHEAIAFLTSMARAVDVDLATIEAKHASTRRITHLRSTQTWVPSLESVNSEWVIRQVAINEQFGTPEKYRCKPHFQNQKSKKTRKTHGKQKGARGGGGGGCRAFFHIHHQGRKMTASSIRELLERYNALPQDEKERYEQIGQAGTLAWRQGYKSFADEAPRKMFPSESSELTPGDEHEHFVRSDGVIVGANFDPAETLVPYRSRDFEADIKKIRSSVYKAAARARKELEERVASQPWYMFVDDPRVQISLN